MYIELVGLPGAGKTTLVNRLKEFPELKGELVDLFDFKYEILKDKKWKFRFVLFFLYFSPSICIYFLRRSGNRRKSLKRVFSLFVLLFVLRKFRKKKEILIMDQSIVQMLVSIAIYNKKNVDFNVERIFNQCLDIIGIKGDKYFKIAIEIPIEVAIERIKSRHKDNCEFKEMDQGYRESVLQKYSYYFSFISYNLTLFTSYLPDVNTQKLSSFIIGKMG